MEIIWTAICDLQIVMQVRNLLIRSGVGLANINCVIFLDIQNKIHLIFSYLFGIENLLRGHIFYHKLFGS